MINKLKRKLSIVMAIAMVATILPYGNTPKAQAATGTWKAGDNVTVVLNYGTLTIKGTGPMEGYRVSPPWDSYSNSIKHIVIEDGITEIGANSIANHNKAESYYIGKDLSSVDDLNLEYKDLKNITVSPDSEYFTTLDGILYSKDMKTLIAVPSADKTITSVVIPEGVTSIGHRAFYSNTNLKSVTIPEGVTSIGNGAFYGNTELTSLVLPESVTTIGNEAFGECTNLRTINLPSGVTTLGKRVFYRTTNLTSSLEIPEGITEIPYGLFQGAASIKSVTLHDNVTTIGDWAFSGALKLESINLPNSVQTIGNYAFRNTKALRSISIPNGVTTIQNNTFDGSGIASIELPDSVTTIGNAAFANTDNLTSIELSESITSIGNNAFSGNTGLVNIYFYNPLVDIDLSSTTLPDSTIIHGLNSSTAKAYANKHNRIFELIEDTGPTVPIQVLTYDKYTDKSLGITVRLGVGDLKATSVTEVKLGDTVLSNDLWTMFGGKVIIDKSAFLDLPVGQSYFITIAFDDFMETSLRNAKVNVVDTSPFKNPSVKIENHTFDRLEEQVIDWTIDFGTEGTV